MYNKLNRMDLNTKDNKSVDVNDNKSVDNKSVDDKKNLDVKDKKSVDDKKNLDVKDNNSLILYNYTKVGLSVLVQGYRMCKSPKHVEFSGNDISIPSFGWRMSKYVRDINTKLDLKMCMLTKGTYVVEYEHEDKKYDIEILLDKQDYERNVDGKVGRIIRIVMKVLNHKKIKNCNTHNILVSFSEYCKKKVDSFFDVFDVEGEVTKRLAFHEGYWQKLNMVQSRDLDSIFLPKDTKENLLKFIHEFLNEDNHDDYIKYGKPYKCNILLHGLPGSGKTSLINSLATEIKSDIGILTFDKNTDDMKLSEALRTFVDEDDDEKCRILVIEDIDCLFTGRKKTEDVNNSVTFSGLLNCLDGMSRMEGMIIFMTANDISNLDGALLRPGRIDYKVKFDHADEYQVKNMFETFLPEQVDVFSKFYRKVGCKKFTTACLHQFLFDYRKSENILDEMDKFLEVIKEDVTFDGKNMYC